MSIARRAAALVFALVVALTVAPGSALAKKVIVLGFDGLDPDLVREMMDEGRLPNLSRMAKTGGFTDLA